MKNMKSNVGSFATAKLQAKMRSILAIIAIMAVIGFSISCGGGDDNGGGGNGNGNGNGNGTTTPVAPTITTTSLPNGRVGTAYSQTLTATGDTPITWSRESGTLPTGLTLSNAGVIAGTPSASGTSNFTVKATNAKGNNTKSLSITIAAGSSSGTAPTITTTSLPNGRVGTAYSQTLTATGDTPITWSRESGTLPTGLTLSNAGVIAGTPSASGTYNFTVKASNAAGNITKQLSITIAAGSTTPSGPQWTAVADSTFGTSNISAIAYANGKFVAGGADGKMAYSTDGTTWTAVDTGTLFDYVEYETTKKGSILAIAYGNGIFVAGGDSRKMATSADGTTWTAISKSTPYPGYDCINAIAYGNGKFVASGYDKMATSTDGETWTAVANSTLNQWILAIAYGNGNFVAGNSNGKMAVSTDGETWTAVANSTFGTRSIYAIAYGNGKFVACGENGKMATSTDGTTWTAVANSTFGTRSIYAIAYGNGKFVAGGADGRMAYLSDN